MRHIQIIRLNDLVKLLKVSKSSIFNWGNPKSRQFKPDFPAKIRISERSVGWSLTSIERWLEDQSRKNNSKNEEQK